MSAAQHGSARATTRPPVDETSRDDPTLSPTWRTASRAIIAGTIASTALIAQQVAGKAIRDALFLSTYQTKHLPHAMAAASVVSLITAVTFPSITSRFSPRRLMPLLFGASGVGFVLEWLLVSMTRHAGALAVYLHTTVVGPILITTFWSLINERFDPHSAKKAIAPVTGGGTVGGVVGGLLAWRISTMMSAPASILMLAGLSAVCAISVSAIPPRRDSIPPPAPLGAGSGLEEPETAETRARTTPLSAVGLLRTVPFLRNLALLVGLGAVISSLLDYSLGVQAVAHYGKGGNLLSFFSVFGLIVAVFSLFIQVAFGRIAIEKLALAVHLAILPGVVLLGGAFGIAVPGLASASVLRGAEMVHRNTLFRSAYELLYTPISERQKRATKVIIDVGFDRAGTVIGSLITMVVIYFIAPDSKTVLGLVVFFALAALPIVRKLHAGYVQALEERLREGVAAHATDAAPASVDPADDRARDRLIHHADALRAQATTTAEQLSVVPNAKTTDEVALENAKEIVAVSEALLSNDVARARRALAKLDESTKLAAGPAILLLGHKTLHHEAKQALQRIAGSITGQLIDILLDADTDVVVRRRLPSVLAAAPSQRAADGLLMVLSDARFEVRYVAARTLARIAVETEEPEPKLTIPPARIEQIVIEEAARQQKVVATVDEETLSEQALAPLDIVIQDRVTRGIEHLFTLLSMLIDRQALRLCFRALHQEDVRYRGAALEYLSVTLPTHVRDAVWPLLGEAGPLPTPRSASDVLDDLTRAIRLEHHEGEPNDRVPPSALS